jgi:hypothetical protein
MHSFDERGFLALSEPAVVPIAIGMGVAEAPTKWSFGYF